jgi:hypothetical protein
MDFNRYFKTSWNLMLTFIVPLIIMTLVMFGIGFLTFGILLPVMMAGYIHSVLRMIRENREPKFQDLFSQMKLFFPLLGFIILVFIITGIGFLLLLFPGILITFALAFCFIFMLPLMVDKEMRLFEAAKQSYSMSVKGQFMDHLVLVILYFGIMAIGSSVFIGTLFTLPFTTILLLLAYEDRSREFEINLENI